MQKEPVDLESYFLYRLISIVYIIAQIIGILFAFIAGIQSWPRNYIDVGNSYIACSNGKEYLINTIEIYPFSLSFSAREDVAVRKACEYGIKNDYLNQYRTPEKLNYTITPVEATQGGIVQALLWWGAGSSIIFILIYVCKQTLIYLFFGNKVKQSA